MLIDRNIVQDALEALDVIVGEREIWCVADTRPIVEALRAALAAPQPEPVADDEVATFINTMAGQFALVIAEIWHAHPDYGIRQTLDELNRRFPAPQPEPASTWSLAECERVMQTLRYLQGIAERGEGRPMRDDETLECFILGYVKKLEGALPAPQPERLRGRRAAAEATLNFLGYTYHGGELWKPPLGPVPLTDAKVAELRSQHGWAKETIRAIERAIRETTT